MSQQKIIRNVTTMDRGPVVRVTTEDVLKAARAYEDDDFTTYDIAFEMDVEEYPVRAAMSWLLKRRLVEVCGKRFLFTKTNHVKYPVVLYRVRPEATEADFAALNRAFGFA